MTRSPLTIVEVSLKTHLRLTPRRFRLAGGYGSGSKREPHSFFLLVLSLEAIRILDGRSLVDLLAICLIFGQSFVHQESTGLGTANDYHNQQRAQHASSRSGQRYDTKRHD